MIGPQLRELKRDLDTATERLNSLIEEAEKALVDLGMGVTASVALDETHSLAFCKDGNEWVLVILDSNNIRQRLRGASKRFRTIGAGALPSLFSALHKAAEEQLREIIKATDAVDDWLHPTLPYTPRPDVGDSK